MPITARPARFIAPAHAERSWYGGDPVASAYFTVLSLAFPSGERFFVETMGAVADQLPPELAAEVRDFIRQEANHARQHRAFNRYLAAAGYPATDLEQTFAARMARAEQFPPLLRVAFTAALEHLTSTIARVVLRDPRLFADAAPEIASFWRWHAVEEIEHKAVAFDAFTVLARSMSRFRRWQLRVRSIVIAALVMLSYARITGEVLVASGADPQRTKRQLAWFLLGRPGLYRRCVPGLLAFLVPGYHPSWSDDRRLLAAAGHAAVDVSPGQALDQASARNRARSGL